MLLTATFPIISKHRIGRRVLEHSRDRIKVNSLQCPCFWMIAVIWMMTSLPIIIEAQGILAKPADAFVESIGVNTHWGSSNVYTKNYTTLKAKLGECGIRYLRDGAYAQAYVRAMDLYQSLGIRTNMLTGRRSGPYPAPLDPSKLDAELDEIKTQALNATVFWKLRMNTIYPMVLMPTG